MDGVAAPGGVLAADARIAAARTLVPLAREIRDQANEQAHRISGLERRYGSPEIMHLAKLLDDVRDACSNLIADIEDGDDSREDQR